MSRSTRGVNPTVSNGNAMSASVCADRNVHSALTFVDSGHAGWFLFTDAVSR